MSWNIPSASWDDTKLWGAADTPENHSAIQKGLNRLMKQAVRNDMKFNKEKCKVLLVHAEGLIDWKAALWREAWGSLWTSSWTWASSVSLWLRRPMVSCVRRITARKLWEVTLPLYSALGESTSGVLGPVLSSLVQDRDGHTEETPAMGHKDR